MEHDRLVGVMQGILGPEGVISEREQLRSYECDGLMNYRVIPELVVLPETRSRSRASSNCATRRASRSSPAARARGSRAGRSRSSRAC
jgi:glycolate oxidase